MTTLVDSMDNAVSQAYRAWPERLFVVDRSGRVRYASRPGPAGFDPGAWESAIRAVVEASTADPAESSAQAPSASGSDSTMKR